jgi:hypothetical protein
LWFPILQAVLGGGIRLGEETLYVILSLGMKEIPYIATISSICHSCALSGARKTTGETIGKYANVPMSQCANVKSETISKLAN